MSPAGDPGAEPERTGAADEVVITVATHVDDEWVSALERLVPQLSRSSPPPSATELHEIVGNPNTALFVARVAGAIVGTLTLALYRIPTGLKAWIDDVVVDAAASRRGIGEALNRAALDEARRRGAKAVDLTSRPEREAANRLYQRIGFAPRSTNVYRLDLRKD